MANTRKLENKPGGRTISLLAHADLTAYLLYAPDPATNTITKLSAAGASMCGTPKVAAKSGQPVTLDLDGILIVTAGEALATPGTPVKAAATGKVVAATVGTDHVIGTTITTAAADGDLLTIEKL